MNVHRKYPFQDRGDHHHKSKIWTTQMNYTKRSNENEITKKVNRIEFDSPVTSPKIK